MRKNLLEELIGAEPELTAVNSGSAPALRRAAPLGSKGTVGAMSRALAQIASDRDVGHRTGIDVVEIDTNLLVDSVFRDRLEDVGGGGVTLVTSIREAGQQVPILVRPAPHDEGKYQIAYGHRRVAALRELGRPVRALVRQMTDDEMIVAQGAENGARKDLSFIERSHFAWILESRGIGRATIMAALSVDKTELSRLISVMRSIPLDIVEEVGPAPKAGRRRWIDFAGRIEPRAVLQQARRIIGSERFKAIQDSDARFLALFSATAPKRPALRQPEVWTDEDGRRLAHVERASGRFVLSIDEALEPEFGDYLLRRLPDLLTSFRSREGTEVELRPGSLV